ncbi:MAG: LmbE family protein, partial [Thermoanaerobaculia bacterium]
FSTVVVGPRAYQASQDLINNNSYLLNYVKNGGTLVVQYGQYEMAKPGVMPYPVTYARPADRITEEVAPFTILDAKSPALNYPNRITAADFNGWVQERSLYMPHTFDSHYHAIMSGNDPGEQPNSGAILVTPYGKGMYVYTTLSFFRQLPAGNSGGTRLFVNLLSTKAPH